MPRLMRGCTWSSSALIMTPRSQARRPVSLHRRRLPLRRRCFRHRRSRIWLHTCTDSCRESTFVRVRTQPRAFSPRDPSSRMRRIRRQPFFRLRGPPASRRRTTGRLTRPGTDQSTWPHPCRCGGFPLQQPSQRCTFQTKMYSVACALRPMLGEKQGPSAGATRGGRACQSRRRAAYRRPVVLSVGVRRSGPRHLTGAKGQKWARMTSERLDCIIIRRSLPSVPSCPYHVWPRKPSRSHVDLCHPLPKTFLRVPRSFSLRPLLASRGPGRPSRTVQPSDGHLL